MALTSNKVVYIAREVFGCVGYKYKYKVPLSFKPYVREDYFVNRGRKCSNMVDSFVFCKAKGATTGLVNI